jgi:hypothetical protein
MRNQPLIEHLRVELNPKSLINSSANSFIRIVEVNAQKVKQQFRAVYFKFIYLVWKILSIRCTAFLKNLYVVAF